MVTNNINKEIRIKTTLWLVYDKEEKNKMLSCKAVWNRYSGGSMITLFQLMKDGQICVTNANSDAYCKSRFIIDETRSWNSADHKEILKLLKKWECYDTNYFN